MVECISIPAAPESCEGGCIFSCSPAAPWVAAETEGGDRAPGLGDWIQSPLPSTLSARLHRCAKHCGQVGRWTLGVSSLLTARVSSRTSDKRLVDRLLPRHASGRCISASFPARLPRRRSPRRPKAGAPARARDGRAVRSPCGSPTAQVRSRLWLKCVFAFRLAVGQAPRLPAAQGGNRSGCPTSRTRLRLLYARTGGA